MRRSAAVLLIGNTMDAHCDALADAFNRRGIVFFRLNLDELRAGSVAVELEAGSTTALRLAHVASGRSMDVTDATCIFFRRGDVPEWASEQPAGQHANALDRYVRSELNELLWNILYSHSDRAFTLLHKSHVWSRTAQNRLMRDLGWRVPETLITNVPAAASRFQESYGAIVVKPLGNVEQSIFGGISHLYTSEVDSVTFDFDEVAACPTLFMERIEKVSDIRAVVVGDRVFAVEMIQNDRSGRHIDVRATDLENIEYKVYQFTPDKENLLVRSAAAFGQPFGHFDFGLLQDGNLVFFENNLNGQWLWIETQSGLQITDAIVDHVSQVPWKRCTRHASPSLVEGGPAS